MRAAASRTVNIDEAYLVAAASTVQDRLKRAGVRLGAILNTVLAADQADVASLSLEHSSELCLKIGYDRLVNHHAHLQKGSTFSGSCCQREKNQRHRVKSGNADR